MNGNRVDLLTNETGNGADKIWPGGKTAFIAEGSFSTSDVKLQIRLPQGTYADVTDATLDAAGMAVVDLPPGTYRAVATATDVYASLVKIDI